MTSNKSAYWQKLRDPRWQKLRLKILERAGWKCEDCGATESNLQVHHCCYRKDADPLDYNEQDLRCLCEDCYIERRIVEEQLKSVFARIALDDLREFSDVIQRAFVSGLSCSHLSKVILSILTEDEQS